MNFNDLLAKQNIDSRHVLVFRHRPPEPSLRRVLPRLAAAKPELFNAYQQTQGQRLESSMKVLAGSGFVASFIGHEPGRAMFVGLYAIDRFRPMNYKQFWAMPAHRQLRDLGMTGWRETDRHGLWFDLRSLDFYSSWQGRLVIEWPPPELVWWRRAHKNELAILAISDESALAPTMPTWSDLDLTWSELKVLPAGWRSALAHWRGIYFIFDESDAKGYVGSAYGDKNILGRWVNYAAKGHGGNVLLRKRDPEGFRFSILQRVSPDMEAADVIQLEASWKRRLHTRAPNGLNEN